MSTWYKIIEVYTRLYKKQCFQLLNCQKLNAVPVTTASDKKKEEAMRFGLVGEMEII